MNNIFTDKYDPQKDMYIGRWKYEKLDNKALVSMNIRPRRWWENDLYLIDLDHYDPLCLVRGNVRIRAAFQSICDFGSLPFFLHSIPSLNPFHFDKAYGMHDFPYSPNRHYYYYCVCDDINEKISIDDERWMKIVVTRLQADLLLSVGVRAQGGNAAQAAIRYRGVRMFGKNAWNKDVND